MNSLIRLITFPIVFIAEQRKAVTAALLTIIFLIIPAFIIGSMLYAEADLDQVKLVREKPLSQVVKSGLKSSRFIGPTKSKSHIITADE